MDTLKYSAMGIRELKFGEALPLSQPLIIPRPNPRFASSFRMEILEIVHSFSIRSTRFDIVIHFLLRLLSLFYIDKPVLTGYNNDEPKENAVQGRVNCKYLGENSRINRAIFLRAMWYSKKFFEILEAILPGFLYPFLHIILL